MALTYERITEISEGQKNTTVRTTTVNNNKRNINYKENAVTVIINKYEHIAAIAQIQNDCDLMFARKASRKKCS